MFMGDPMFSQRFSPLKCINGDYTEYSKFYAMGNALIDYDLPRESTNTHIA